MSIEHLPGGAGSWQAYILYALIVLVPLLCTKSAGHIPGIFGAIGRWRIARNASNPQLLSYQALRREVSELAESNKRQGDELKDHRVRLDEMDRRLIESNKRLYTAVGYIQRLRNTIRRIAPDHDIEAVPSVLEELI